MKSCKDYIYQTLIPASSCFSYTSCQNLDLSFSLLSLRSFLPFLALPIYSDMKAYTALKAKQSRLIHVNVLVDINDSIIQI